MPVYSHSRLSTFEQCPLKYRYKYIDLIEKPDEETIEVFLGKRVHEVLQKLHEDVSHGMQNSVEGLLVFYKSRWDANWNPAVKIVKSGYTARDYLREGADCIRNYYRVNQPFTQSETLQTEAHITFSLDPGSRFQMQGYIDRVARRSDGTYEIHDYKTSRYLPSQRQADSDRQLALYQIALPFHWKDAKRIDLIWHYLRHGKTIRSNRSSEELVQVAKGTIALIQKIERKKVFEPRKSALCDWCEYKPECPAWVPRTKTSLQARTLGGNIGRVLGKTIRKLFVE